MSSTPAKPFRTDALNPTSNPSRQPIINDPNTPKDPNAELDKAHEEWNARIDKEIKACATGLEGLIRAAEIPDNPSSQTPTLLPLTLKTSLSQLIKSTQNLRDMAHELKLHLILSDRVSEVAGRDKEATLVRKEVVEARRKVVGEVGLLFRGEDAGSSREEVDEGMVEVDKVKEVKGDGSETGQGAGEEVLERGKKDSDDEDMEEV